MWGLSFSRRLIIYVVSLSVCAHLSVDATQNTRRHKFSNSIHKKGVGRSSDNSINLGQKSTKMKDLTDTKQGVTKTETKYYDGNSEYTSSHLETKAGNVRIRKFIPKRKYQHGKGKLPEYEVGDDRMTKDITHQNKYGHRRNMPKIKKDAPLRKQRPLVATPSQAINHRKQISGGHRPIRQNSKLRRQSVSADFKNNATRHKNTVVYGTKNESSSMSSPSPRISTILPFPDEDDNSLEELVISQRIAQFKEILLEKLRMSEDDLSTDKSHESFPKLPESILQGYMNDKANEEAVENFYAHDKELIIAGKDFMTLPKHEKCIRHRKVTGCYLFELNGKVRAEVISAQLLVYKTPDANDIKRQTLRVFQVEKDRRGRVQHKSLMIRQNTWVKEDWVKINITRSVQRLLVNKPSEVMVAIQCDTCKTRSHRALYGAKNGYTPLLIINYDTPNLLARKRRTASTCDPRYECCKRDLVINFKQLQYAMIVQPKNISIGYCFGSCDNRSAYRYIHTELTQRARIIDSSFNESVRNQLHPCCVPLSLRDTLLIIQTETGIVRTAVPGVIVSDCDCL